jgi:HJR/Mrr/RecB family endonuclease
MDMPRIQAQAYTEVVSECQSGHLNTLEALHRYRFISLHPAHPSQAEGITFENYVDMSARMKQTIEILDEIAKRHEKALIFLESRDMQEVLGQIIKQRYHLPRVPLTINGSVTGDARQKAVDDFQSETGSFDAMILSPKAGGVGLTLTTANNVIHLQRWWNPAVEDQCTDRVYRIGQDQDVHIYLPLAIHSEFRDQCYDNVLNKLLNEKRHLARGIFVPTNINSGSFKENMEFGDEADQRHIDLEEIDRMEPLAFENWVASEARREGLIARLTPTSHDAGADLICENNETGRAAIIQCKHRGRPGDIMDQSPVQDLVRARTQYDSNNPVLMAVTNAERYSAPTIDLAKRQNVELVARDQLATAMNDLAKRLGR